MPLSRRQFLRNVVLAGAAATAPVVWRLVRPGRIARAEERPKRQWSMVIDLRKCEGCRTIDKPPQCAEACIKSHSLSPDQPWIRVYEVKSETGGSYFQPTPCMHCEDAPCVKVCPVGATFQNGEGAVLIDERVCIGCRMCMAACPYGVRTFNWFEPAVPAGTSPADYTPQTSTPQRRGTPSKCMFCAHRTSEGKLPACAEGCPMNAIYFGDRIQDVATNGKELVRLSDFLIKNNAYRLKAELGTHPRVWYIPGHGESFGRG